MLLCIITYSFLVRHLCVTTGKWGFNSVTENSNKAEIRYAGDVFFNLPDGSLVLLEDGPVIPKGAAVCRVYLWRPSLDLPCDAALNSEPLKSFGIYKGSGIDITNDGDEAEYKAETVTDIDTDLDVDIDNNDPTMELAATIPPAALRRNDDNDNNNDDDKFIISTVGEAARSKQAAVLEGGLVSHQFVSILNTV